MAPEQARCEPLDHRCDLFSLGCVLYRLATGAPAFRGSTVVQVLRSLEMEQPRPPRELNAEVPPALADLIVQLLAKDRTQHPASAQDLALALECIDRALSLQETALLPAAGQPAAGETGPVMRRRGLLAGAAVLLGAWAWRDRSSAPPSTTPSRTGDKPEARSAEWKTRLP